MAEAVIAVAGLRKAYGEVEAVRGVDLVVRRGEVFAFLGPNGAGKTTTVEILEGFRERDAGEVEVLGADPAVARRDWRQRIGVVLQESEVPGLLTVRESLELFAGYFERSRADRRDDRAGRARGAGRPAGGASSRAASGGGSTSRSRSSARPSCCSSTSRRPASIPPRGGRPGRSSRACASSARRSC